MGFVWNSYCCFISVNQRDQRETLGFRLCNIAWVLLRVILPQIALITQRNAASCIISQRKTGWLLWLLWLLELWGFFVIIWEICGRYWGFLCANRLSTLM